MPSLKTFTEGQIAEIRKLIKEGMKPTVIARMFGVAHATVMRAIDQKYRERRAAQIARAKGKETKAILPRSFINKHKTRNREIEDAILLMKQIPPDTRDLTGRICGDPLPERSALYQRRKAEGSGRNA